MARFMDVALAGPNEEVLVRYREVIEGLDWTATSILAELLAGDDERVGREAAHALGRVNWRYKSILPLEKAFQAPDAAVRARAVVAYALGGCWWARVNSMRRVVDLLLEAATDADHRVRWLATAALLAEYHDEIREANKRALLERGVPYVRLSAAALNDSDWYVRRWAINAIGRNEERDAAQALLAAYRSEKEGDLRREALFYLGRTFQPLSVDLLVSALDDHDHGVRHEAIATLKQYGDSRVIPALKRVIEDHNVAWTMQHSAREAIEAIRARGTASTRIE